MQFSFENINYNYEIKKNEINYSHQKPVWKHKKL